MTEYTIKNEADLGSAPISEKIAPKSFTSEEIIQDKNYTTTNAYIVKNSRYIKREKRDPRLYRSPLYDDYLIPKSELDLAVRIGAEYALVEVFDELAEESSKIRELTTKKIWREDEFREKTAKLIDASVANGCPIEEAKYSTNKEIHDLFERCRALPAEIEDIGEQIRLIRKQSQGLNQKELRSLTHSELIERTIPPREFILSPWIPEASVAMVFAPPGIGKTNLGLAISYAVASGGKLFHWHAPKPRKVLYIDAEMHESDLQSRAKRTGAGFITKIPDPSFLRYINGTWQSKEIGIPDLSTVDGQRIIEAEIKDATFIVIDNLSTVCRTGNENESSSWAKMQNWLLSLRWKGIAILIIHHAGKSKDEGGIPIQRGSSAREVILEANLALKRPKGYSPDSGCEFEVHFLKARGFFGVDAEPFEAKMHIKNDAFVWTHRKLETKNYDRVIELINDGITTPKDIAEELGISRQAVQKHIKRAKKEGDLS